MGLEASTWGRKSQDSLRECEELVSRGMKGSEVQTVEDFLYMYVVWNINSNHNSLSLITRLLL